MASDTASNSTSSTPFSALDNSTTSYNDVNTTTPYDDVNTTDFASNVTGAPIDVTAKPGLFGLTDEIHIVVVGAALAIGIIAVIAIVLRLLMPCIRRGGRSGKSTPLVPSTPSTQLSRASSRGSGLEAGWGDNSSQQTRLSYLGSKDNLLATPTFSHNGKASPLGGSSPALSRLALPLHGSSPSLFKMATNESDALPSVNHLGVPPFSKPVGGFSYTAGGSLASLQSSGSCPALNRLGRGHGGSNPSINTMGVASTASHASQHLAVPTPFNNFKGNVSKAPIYLPPANSMSPYQFSQSQERLNSNLIAVISPAQQEMETASLHEAYVKNWNAVHNDDVTSFRKEPTGTLSDVRTKL